MGNSENFPLFSELFLFLSSHLFLACSILIEPRSELNFDSRGRVLVE